MAFNGVRSLNEILRYKNRQLNTKVFVNAERTKLLIILKQ